MCNLTDLLPAFDQISSEEIARLSPKNKYRLYTAIANDYKRVRYLKRILSDGLMQSYAGRICSMQEQSREFFGNMCFQEGPLHISIELFPKVCWKQKELARLYQELSTEMSDTQQYIDVIYAVPEMRFYHWPKALQERFAVARVLKKSKPLFKLNLMEISSDAV